MAAGLAFPHAAQAIQIVRRRWPLNGKKCSTETVHAVTGNGPRVMASLRNLGITILCLAGDTSIGAAWRHHARQLAAYV